ncbi:MAG: addiction module protein [Verrucomicrobiota bacterium]
MDLKQMSLPDKLRLMEALWDELCRREEDIAVPEWQKQVLDERERQIEEGTATFRDWETTKQRIAIKITWGGQTGKDPGI